MYDTDRIPALLLTTRWKEVGEYMICPTHKRPVRRTNGGAKTEGSRYVVGGNQEYATGSVEKFPAADDACSDNTGFWHVTQVANG